MHRDMDKDVKIRKHKVLALIFGVCMALCLAGCSGRVPEDVLNDVKSALETRSVSNIRAAESLHNAGLFTDEQYNLIVRNIENNTNRLVDGLGNNNMLLNLLTSVTDWQIVINNDITNPHVFEDTNNDGELEDLGPSKSNEEFASQFITNYLAFGNVQNNSDSLATLVNNNLPITHDGGQVNPIVMVNEDAAGNINEIAGFPIQVLNVNFDNQGLDEIVEAIRAGVEAKDETILQRYFHELTYTKIERDNNGIEIRRTTAPLTLMDTSKPENQLVRNSIGGYVDSDNIFHREAVGRTIDIHEGENGLGGRYYIRNSHEGKMNGEGCPGSNGSCDPLRGIYRDSRTLGQENRLGCDLVIRSLIGTTYELMSVRLAEFNQDAIDKIMQTFGLEDNKYFILNNKIYVMEYPVGYIAGFKETADRAGYESIIKKSQLSINIRTGDLFKSKLNADGTIDSTSRVKISDTDPYYTLRGALGPDEEALASFIIHGETGISVEGTPEDPLNTPWNLRYGEAEDPIDNSAPGIRASVGRIVLRDYLEATYAPGIIIGANGEERLVALGRKLRILNLSGDKQSQTMAKFYGIDGKVIEDSSSLYINDFADIPSVLQSVPVLSYISAAQERLGPVGGSSSDSGGTSEPDTGGTPESDEVATLSDAGDTPSDSGDTQSDGGDTQSDGGDTTGASGSADVQQDFTGVLRGSLSRVDTLPKVIVSEIHMSTTFPGSYIDAGEESYTDDKPFMYAMFVKKNIFESGLFSGWVNATDTSKNSVAWWNTWLGNHGFSYKINSDSLVSFLEGNYAYELNKAGIIVLDLRTIAHIQQDMKEEHEFWIAKMFRTGFILLGYALIAYSVILLVAWNVDVNVDLGLNFLEKFTFGKWIAIRSTDETPNMNTEDTKYINFSKLLVSSLEISVVGLVLIFADMMGIVLALMDLFGGIADKVSMIISG